MSAGYRLQVTSYRLHAQVIGCMQQAASYKLQATSYRLQATGSIQAAGCKLQLQQATSVDMIASFLHACSHVSRVAPQQYRTAQDI